MSPVIPSLRSHVACAICLGRPLFGTRLWTHIGGERHDGFHKECLRSALQQRIYCPWCETPINPNFPLSKKEWMASTFEKYTPPLSDLPLIMPLLGFALLGAGAAIQNNWVQVMGAIFVPMVCGVKSLPPFSIVVGAAVLARFAGSLIGSLVGAYESHVVLLLTIICGSLAGEVAALGSMMLIRDMINRILP